MCFVDGFTKPQKIFIQRDYNDGFNYSETFFRHGLCTIIRSFLSVSMSVFVVLCVVFIRGFTHFIRICPFQFSFFFFSSFASHIHFIHSNAFEHDFHSVSIEKECRELNSGANRIAKCSVQRRKKFGIF